MTHGGTSIHTPTPHCAASLPPMGGRRLMHELLTSGTAPCHWLATADPQLLFRRLQTDDPVPVPGGAPEPGLPHTNVLRAADLANVPAPWRVQRSSPNCLERLKRLMEQCLASEPAGRPTLAHLLEQIRELQAAEAAAGAPAGAMYVRH